MEFEHAIEVFACGFAFTRSVTHPYEVERLEGVLRLHDAPRRRAADNRTEEFVVADLPAETVDTLARRNARGRYCISYLLPEGASDTAIRAQFKALGYRLGHTEFFMAHRLRETPAPPEPFPIVRVTDESQAAALAKAAGKRMILPQHLSDPSPQRQYMALDGDTPVGWVSSIAAAGASWCNAMFVRPDYRRRGIARALMARMLADDRAAGASANVLLASHTGSKLYPTVGYEDLGKLYLFTPPKAKA